jgi:hypothetical protein
MMHMNVVYAAFFEQQCVISTQQRVKQGAYSPCHWLATLNERPSEKIAQNAEVAKAPAYSAQK